MSKQEPKAADHLATLKRALDIIRSSKRSGGGMTIVHADGSVTEDRWTATYPEGTDDAQSR